MPKMPTAGIIWLASYPKSGNTWLRFLLYNYLYGEVRKTDDVAKKIPDIHVHGTVLHAQKPEPIFCKTHLMLSDRHPNLSETTGYIYVLRHPRDVMLSNLNYFKMISDAGSFSEQQFARKFIANMGVRMWIDKGMGTWQEHASSWLLSPRYPHITLRYESMLQDPHANLRNVLEFLKIPVDKNRLNHAIHLSSFDKMRALEEAEMKRGESGVVFSGGRKTKEHGLRFMNKGKVGYDLRQLGEDVQQEFNEKFRDALRVFGYE